MESKLVDCKEEILWKFPCNGISHKYGTIVFFTSIKEGTVIKGDNRYDVGNKSKGWDMDCFRPIEIKEDVESESKIDWKFPCPGINDDGLVVLFKNKDEGIVIKGNNHFGIYHESKNWAIGCFRPLPKNKQIILRNI